MTAETKVYKAQILPHCGLKPCQHCRKKCDCRRKRRDNGEIRRLSHFSATVWTDFNRSGWSCFLTYLFYWM